MRVSMFIVGLTLSFVSLSLTCQLFVLIEHLTFDSLWVLSAIWISKTTLQTWHSTE